MARSRYRFGAPDQVHFLTATVVEWLPVFTRRESVEIILDSWRFLQAQDGLRLYGYVILENHLHAVVQADNLPKSWASFKSYTALRILKLLVAADATPLLTRLGYARKSGRTDREHQFWQEGSHPQELSNAEMLRQKLEYIHQNPVMRGYVDNPEDWRWSSARNYAGREGVIEIFQDW